LNPDTHTVRALKVKDGVIYAPPAATGWGEHTYLIVIPVVASTTSAAMKRERDASTGFGAEGLTNGAAGEQAKSEPAARIFVGNVPWSVGGPAALEVHFPGATEISVPVHMDTGKIKGFAYVSYATVELVSSTLCAHSLSCSLPPDASYGTSVLIPSPDIRSFSNQTFAPSPTRQFSYPHQTFTPSPSPVLQAEEMLKEKGDSITIDGRQCNLDFAPYGAGSVPGSSPPPPPSHPAAMPMITAGID
jgi:hypothetical protein